MIYAISISLGIAALIFLLTLNYNFIFKNNKSIFPWEKYYKNCIFYSSVLIFMDINIFLFMLNSQFFSFHILRFFETIKMIFYILSNFNLLRYIIFSNNVFKNDRTRYLKGLRIFTILVIFAATISSFVTIGMNPVVKEVMIIIYYAYMISTLIFSILCFLNKRNRISKDQTKLAVFSLLISIIFLFLNFTFNISDAMYIYSFTMVLFILHNFIQNPDLYIDKITGAYNREGMILYSKHLIEKRKNFSFIGVNIREFKLMNSHYGYETMDKFLQKIKDCLSRYYKDQFVFKLFGSSFIVILRSKKINVDNLDYILRNIFDNDNYLNKTSFSFDCCYLESSEHFSSVFEFLELVEHTIKKIKILPTPTYKILTNEDVSNIKRYILIENVLKDCIETNSIEVFYQPIFDVKKQKYISAEALARLKNPELGYISPGEFIPIAEECGLIVKLGEQIFEKVCHFISYSDILNKGIKYIEINLSPAQCFQDTLSDNLLKIIHRYGISLSSINLEITETSAYSNDNNLINNIKELHSNDISFALDDYGTGFSNLERMLTLPFEFIKLDRTLITSFCEKKNHILRYVVPMFIAEGFKIIAEGVETESQYITCKELGIHYIQGFYFSKPLSIEKFLEFLETC